MPDLAFRVDTAKMVPFSASPLLALDLEITNEPTAEAIHAIMLHERAVPKTIHRVDFWKNSTASSLRCAATAAN